MVANTRSFLRLLRPALFAVLAAGPALAQSPVDAIGVPGPFNFDNESYALAWTADPQHNFYTQEYLPAGQDFESWTEMFTIQALTGGVSVEDGVAMHIAMLDERKATDPVVNYEVIRNDQTGEVVIDFLLSADTAGGELFVEWNVYRFAAIEDGVALYGAARRAYGEAEAKAFIGALKDTRPVVVNAMAQFDLPPVTTPR